jgi:hypothetical protein
MSYIIEELKESDFIIYKDEPNDNDKSILGVTQNRIVEIPNFVDDETAKNMIAYFESKAEMWGHIAFYGSSGMGIMPDDPDLDNFNLPRNFFEKIKDKYQESVEFVFGREVKPNTSHAQKWMVGGFAAPHSDNSDFDGVPNSFQINKYVGILYLNNDYEGGTLYFPDHEIEFKPRANSFIVFPGGVENVHGVSEITSGTRYTMVSFWDYKESEYSEETLAEFEEELKGVREEQAKQREEWEKGNKYA